ncbi:MAG: T9SS type A sorting domain-containing protein, partial [Candidatus Marinimicrobia bacterium]|nr:T9SS type A sorting domain-containing protein [Candidatus Neomarinimicrobiota bacterium]
THFQVFSPIAQQGKVSIINLSGQKVVDLGVVHLNPGNQIFSWDHQTFINLPSGQYLIKLKTDELMATHKITLVK